jgi:hypothetical protein
VLTVPAAAYGTDLPDLLDGADPEATPEQDRVVLAALLVPAGQGRAVFP